MNERTDLFNTQARRPSHNLDYSHFSRATALHYDIKFSVFCLVKQKEVLNITRIEI